MLVLILWNNMKFQFARYLAGFLFGLLISISPAFAFDSFVVQKIKIDGLKRISQDAVLQELNLKVGQKLTSDKAQQIIKSLYKTNFFKDVQLERDGNNLVVKLKERSIISKLEITGIKSKDPINKILKEAQIIEGLVYDPGAIHKAEREIERHYLSRGRYGVQVVTKVNEQLRDRVEVTFSIYEGDEAKIKEIKIIGNTKFKESVLLKKFFHGKTNWLSWYTKNDRYFKEKLDADLEVLQSYYMDRGYINFQVDSTQVSLTADKKHVYITINITEGEQYQFGKITLSGQFILPKKEFETIVDSNLKDGDTFSRKVLWETKKQIEDKLGDVGYSKSEARLNFETIEEQRKINVDIAVSPNQRIMVRKVMISGNYLTQDFVLRRMLPQFESTWVSNKDIQEGKQHILRYGYAGKVDVVTHPVVDKEDQVDLEYKMEEQRTMQLHAGISYSGSEGLGYNLGADVKNFIGTGRDVGFLFENSKVTTSYKFNYYNPYFTMDGLGFGYDLYFQRHNLSRRSNIFDYSTDNIGGNLSWSMPVSQYSASFLGFGYNETKLHTPGNPPLEIKDFTKKKGFSYQEYIVNVGWRYNSLDRYIFPTSGLTQRAVVKQNVPPSKLKYYVLSYESSWYKPIVDSYIFNFSSDLSYGGKYGNDPYPFFRNFFIGGADSLRGFEERSLGPKDSQHRPIGGNLLVNFRTAVIFPVPFKPDLENVRPSLFMDIGQVYDTYNKYNRDPNRGLRYAAGVSVAINTPLGVPVTLSLAKPLNAKKNDQKETFSFTFAANY